MEFAGPLDGLDVGGVAHAIVGTLIQIGIALAISIPLGIVTALFLNEVGGRFARFVRTIVEAMTALPSIVAGLFIYAALILALAERSGFAAALAITVMMLPIIIRAADVVLRLVAGQPAGGVVRARRVAAGARCGTSCCRRRVGPRRPRSSSAPPAASARPRRCCSPRASRT